MGVLIHTEIEEKFGSIFRSGASIDNIQAAKYYLTLGVDFLILPDGTRCAPQEPYEEPFILKPGQSAVVSTKERLVMPLDLIGILGSRFDNAEHGLLFFGGMMVDPGYGVSADNTTKTAVGQPLTFAIGNVGNKPIELRPGKDPIASIAFLSLAQEVKEKSLLKQFLVTGPAKTREEAMRSSKQRQRPAQPLGFVEELEEMRSEVDKAKAAVGQIVLFGVIVLAATLCAAITTAVLTISGELGTASPPIWETLGITLGFGLAAVVVLVVLAYASIRVMACWYGTNRKVRLSRD